MSNIKVRSVGGVTRAFISGADEQYPGDDPIGDAEALRRAMRDERYATSASYRKTVEEAIAESMVIKDAAPAAEVLDGGQLNGRFQVQPQNPHDAPAPEQMELGEHELAMIAKAERHGF